MNISHYKSNAIDEELGNIFIQLNQNDIMLYNEAVERFVPTTQKSLSPNIPHTKSFTKTSSAARRAFMEHDYRAMIKLIQENNTIITEGDYIAITRAYMSMGDFDAAAKTICIREDKWPYAAVDDFAELALLQKRYDDAIAYISAYERLLASLDPVMNTELYRCLALARLRKGSFHFLKGEEEQARRIFAACLEAYRNTDCVTDLAQMACHLRIEEIIQTLCTRMTEPDFPKNLRLPLGKTLSLYYYNAGNYGQSKTILDSILDLGRYDFELQRQYLVLGRKMRDAHLDMEPMRWFARVYADGEYGFLASKEIIATLFELGRIDEAMTFLHESSSLYAANSVRNNLLQVSQFSPFQDIADLDNTLVINAGPGIIIQHLNRHLLQDVAESLDTLANQAFYTGPANELSIRNRFEFASHQFSYTCDAVSILQQCGRHAYANVVVIMSWFDLSIYSDILRLADELCGGRIYLYTFEQLLTLEFRDGLFLHRDGRDPYAPIEALPVSASNSSEN